MKPTKKALALVIKNENGEILIVKRPEDESGPIAGVWGFPAVMIKDGESEIKAAKRVGKDKLGVEIKIIERIGETTGDRDSYTLHLCDYAAEVKEGVPSVPQKDSSVIQYVELKYTADPTILIPAAKRGSLCSQIYLSSIGLSWN